MLDFEPGAKYATDPDNLATDRPGMKRARAYF
jgi:hypothetical protein